MDNNCLFRCQLTATSAATAKWYLNICKDKLRMNDAEQFVLQLLREFMYPVEFNVADDCRLCKDCAQLLPAMLSQISAIRVKQTLVMEAFQDAGIINSDEVEVNAQSSAVDSSATSAEQKLQFLMSEFTRVTSNLVATIDLTEDEVVVKQEPLLDESLEEAVTPEKDRTPRPPLLSPDINSLPSLDSIFPPAVDLHLPSTPCSSTMPPIPPNIAFPPAPENNLPPSIISNYLPLTTPATPASLPPSPERNIAETEAANILLNLADHQQFSPKTPTPFANTGGRDSPDPNDHAPLDPNNIFNIIAKKLNLETKQNLIFGGNMKENTLIPDSKLRMFEGNVNDEDMEIIKNVNPDADLPTVEDAIDEEVEINEDLMDTEQADENIVKPGVLAANQDSNILDIKQGDDEEIIDCKAALMVHLPKPLFIENSTPSKGEFACDTCEFKTKHRSSLKRHSHMHSGGKPKPHVCNVCDYQTANKGHLEVHMRLHTGHRPFKCPTCEFTAMQKSNLQRHMKTHSKEVKPHPCPTCMFRAGCKSDLIIHQRIHTGEKPYKCDECPYRGPSSSCLATHKRKHSNYRPFACKTCEYRTKFLSSLKIHERAHSGTKPFQCTKCSYKAIQQSKINRHMANVHKWEQK